MSNTPAVELTEEQQEARIPRPVGYKLLVALPSVEETYGESGILKVTQAVKDETISTVVGVVIAMGEHAYQDKERYPNGPWCKVGDYVVFRPFSGTRVKVDGVEFRLINEDSIDAVVEDPSGIRMV